ncbi:PREDICTED: translation initiation factor IF-2-like [Chinchilla lanigera]|uniref:translation initiation factor IF-2-like n=1 Tax=Chinchilla lanigera TaxID=34839 RepID=UPI00069625CA|nr:PREDICTED: translation initiation factor IF-2-like [Chinchilla lanigera]
MSAKPICHLRPGHHPQMQRNTLLANLGGYIHCEHDSSLLILDKEKDFEKLNLDCKRVKENVFALHPVAGTGIWRQKVVLGIKPETSGLLGSAPHGQEIRKFPPDKVFLTHQKEFKNVGAKKELEVGTRETSTLVPARAQGLRPGAVASHRWGADGHPVAPLPSPRSTEQQQLDPRTGSGPQKRERAQEREPGEGWLQAAVRGAAGRGGSVHEENGGGSGQMSRRMRRDAPGSSRPRRGRGGPAWTRPPLPTLPRLPKSYRFPAQGPAAAAAAACAKLGFPEAALAAGRAPPRPRRIRRSPCRQAAISDRRLRNLPKCAGPEMAETVWAKRSELCRLRPKAAAGLTGSKPQGRRGGLWEARGQGRTGGPAPRLGTRVELTPPRRLGNPHPRESSYPDSSSAWLASSGVWQQQAGAWQCGRRPDRRQGRISRCWFISRLAGHADTCSLEEPVLLCIKAT